MDRVINTLVVFIVVYLSLNGNGEPYSYPPPRRQCRARNSRTNGICVKFSQCQSAQRNYYNNRVKPAVCVNNPLDPIVCCYSEISQKSSLPTQNGGGIRSGRGSSKIINAQPAKSKKSGGSQRECQAIYDPNRPFPVLIGGTPTAPGEFPYMAAIGWKNPLGSGYSYGCGGSLIHKYYVLTAAHCASVAGNIPDVVRTGGVSVEGDSLSEYLIEAIFVHHGYRPRQAYNDIALIKLERPSSHTPACLWSSGDIVQRQVLGIGYGHTKLVGTGSKVLMKVMLNILSNEECSRFFNPRPKLKKGIVDSQVCAGDPYSLMDTCQGDSGGPILLKALNDNGVQVPYMVGITSYGDGCASGPPSIYTRISSYIDWIESIVWPLG